VSFNHSENHLIIHRCLPRCDHCESPDCSARARYLSSAAVPTVLRLNEGTSYLCGCVQRSLSVINAKSENEGAEATMNRAPRLSESDLVAVGCFEVSHPGNSGCAAVPRRPSPWLSKARYIIAGIPYSESLHTLYSSFDRSLSCGSEAASPRHMFLPLDCDIALHIVLSNVICFPISPLLVLTYHLQHVDALRAISILMLASTSCDVTGRP
jgi:hypothetical protein